MATKTLHITFNGITIPITMLDTPIAEKVLKAHKLNKDLGSKLCTAMSSVHMSGYIKRDLDKEKFYVDKINEGIDLANSSIEGKPFPYRAFYGMSWQDTNRMHRCYTLSSVTGKIWHHFLNEEQLKEYKRLAYHNRSEILRDVPAQYTVTDPVNFEKGCEMINKFIHLHEGNHSCLRGKVADEYMEGIGINGNWSKYCEIIWDAFDPDTGVKNTVKTLRTSYDEIVESFRQTPGEWHDYNVFVVKTIAGKDYDHCYFNFDDPQEYDITNLDCIDGGLRIHINDDWIQFFQSPMYRNWLIENDLDERLTLPIPIGKIDWEAEGIDPKVMIEPNPTGEKNTLGAPALHPPFDKVTDTIIDNNIL